MDIKRAYAAVIEVVEHFPEAVGTVASLLLNRLTLNNKHIDRQCSYDASTKECRGWRG